MDTGLPPESPISSRRIYLALIEPATLIREGLAALFAQTEDIVCTVVAADDESALARPEIAAVDVALVDVSVGDLLHSGELRAWQGRLPKERIVLFDEFMRDLYLRYV